MSSKSKDATATVEAEETTDQAPEAAALTAGERLARVREQLAAVREKRASATGARIAAQQRIERLSQELRTASTIAAGREQAYNAATAAVARASARAAIAAGTAGEADAQKELAEATERAEQLRTAVELTAKIAEATAAKASEQEQQLRSTVAAAEKTERDLGALVDAYLAEEQDAMRDAAYERVQVLTVELAERRRAFAEAKARLEETARAAEQLPREYPTAHVYHFDAYPALRKTAVEILNPPQHDPTPYWLVGRVDPRLR